MNTNSIEKSSELLNLMKDFYNLTQIKICLYDLNGNEVCYFPEKFSSFCGKYRESDTINDLCAQCDKNAIEKCRTLLKPITYTCHIGLTECIAPIMIDNILSGFIVMCQIKKEQYDNELIQTLPANLKKLFNDLPVISQVKIDSSVNILVALTSIEYLKNYIRKIQNTFQTKLINFIDFHLCENLSIDILCEELSITKRELYFLCNQKFNCTPAELVKQRRLYKSTVLLGTTKMSINQIANDCGIGDYNYFSKLFRKQYGITPRDFRKHSIQIK